MIYYTLVPFVSINPMVKYNTTIQRNEEISFNSSSRINIGHWGRDKFKIDTILFPIPDSGILRL